LGDDVVVSVLGGRGQTCKVTGIGLKAEDYGTAKFNPD
jgi:hypothetical protein